MTYIPTSQQQGVLLDTFKLASDADDTSSLTRAIAANVVILLGPRTYIINNFSSGSNNNFIVKGIAGKTVIQRTTATGSTFFAISQSVVNIDGVIFDMNSSVVTANQWGVYLAAGGQNIQIKNCVFKNNSGTIGCGLAITGSGPAAGGSFVISGCEITNCTFDALYLASVTNGNVENCYIHDNSSIGVYIGSNGTASSTNYLSGVILESNKIVRNYTGISVGGYGQPYTSSTFNITPTSNVMIRNNIFEDSTYLSIAIEGDYTSVIGNHIYQTVNTTQALDGINSLSRYAYIADNIITMLNATTGMDLGGSISCVVKNNIITLSAGAALNTGGNQNSVFQGNILNCSGTASAITNYSVEGSGNGYTFPTLSSNTIFENNSINMNGANTKGINLFDNAGGYVGALPNIVKGNHFYTTNSASTANCIIWYGSNVSLCIHDNDCNGLDYAFVVPISNDIVFDLFSYGATIVQQSSSISTIRSIVPRNVTNLNSAGQIQYVTPTNGGSGYSSATVLTASGTSGGTGWTGNAQIVGGVIIGVRTLTQGSGYTGTVTVVATDSGGGTGAVLAPVTVAAIPAEATITFVADATQLLQLAGGYTTILGIPMMLTNGTTVKLQNLRTFSTLEWVAVAYQMPTVTIANLPTVTAVYSGALIGVSNSTTGKWQARCNGTAWIWPDGTTVTV
jgi:hypothetical protein